MKMLRHPIMNDPHNAADLFGTLEALLAQLSAPPSARTARLLRASTARKARKPVEEATEVALDAVSDSPEGLIAESVDLLYHLAVLWHDRGIDPCEIRAEMARRAAVPDITEKPPKKGSARRALEALAKAEPAHRAPAPRQPICALYRKGKIIGRVRMSDLQPA